MISPEGRKQDIISTIEENPTDISFDISTREEVDGAWEITKSTYDLRVRIFQEKNPEVAVISAEKGTANTTMKYGMLVDYASNMIDRAREDITFDSLYGKMEIVGTYPQIVKGIICGYQCDLKRVS